MGDTTRFSICRVMLTNWWNVVYWDRKLSLLFEEGSLGKVQPTLGLRHLIGMSSLKKRASRDARASLTSNEIFPHTLLAGPGGLGKTAFAESMSVDLGYWFYDIEGAMCKARKQLQAKLVAGCEESKARAKRLLFFVDEAHRLSEESQEALYIPMATGRVEGFDGGRGFTIFAATTHPHMLLGPLKSRLCNEWYFSRYEQYDIERMIVKWWQKNNIQWDRKSVGMVAKRSLGIPRNAYNLSQKVRNEVLSRGGNRVVSIHDCAQTFRDEGIDSIGLNAIQVEYLLTLLAADGAPRGVGGLAGALDRGVEVVEESIEPVLLSLGFIERTSRGRMLTRKGHLHLSKTGQLL